MAACLSFFPVQIVYRFVSYRVWSMTVSMSDLCYKFENFDLCDHQLLHVILLLSKGSKRTVRTWCGWNMTATLRSVTCEEFAVSRVTSCEHATSWRGVCAVLHGTGRLSTSTTQTRNSSSPTKPIGLFTCASYSLNITCLLQTRFSSLCFLLRLKLRHHSLELCHVLAILQLYDVLQKEWKICVC